MKNLTQSPRREERKTTIRKRKRKTSWTYSLLDLNSEELLGWVERFYHIISSLGFFYAHCDVVLLASKKVDNNLAP